MNSNFSSFDHPLPLSFVFFRRLSLNKYAKTTGPMKQGFVPCFRRHDKSLSAGVDRWFGNSRFHSPLKSPVLLHDMPASKGILFRTGPVQSALIYVHLKRLTLIMFYVGMSRDRTTQYTGQLRSAYEAAKQTDFSI
jgi:hypothetical protein